MSTKRQVQAEVRNFVYSAAQLPAAEAARMLTSKLLELAARWPEEAANNCPLEAGTCEKQPDGRCLKCVSALGV